MAELNEKDLNQVVGGKTDPEKYEKEVVGNSNPVLGMPEKQTDEKYVIV